MGCRPQVLSLSATHDISGGLNFGESLFTQHQVGILVCPHGLLLTPSLTYSVFSMQVLNPNSNAMLKIITENASEEFLYSLSNYCGLQVGRYSK